MKLDLDSFLQLQSSDDEDEGTPHRTVDEFLNDSDFSSSSSSSSSSSFNTTHSRQREEIPLREENSSKSYETKQYKKGLKAADAILKKIPDHGVSPAMSFSWMNEFSGHLPPLFESVKPNPKPGAALAAAATTSLSIPTPHAAAIKNRRRTNNVGT